MSLFTNERLAEILKKGGFLDEKQLESLSRGAEEFKLNLEDLIVEREILTDAHLGQILASELDIPFVNLRVQSIPEEILNTIPEEFAAKNNVIAFKKDDGGLHVGMHDVNNVHLIQLLEKKIGQSLLVHFATVNDIHQALNQYKRRLDLRIKALADEAIKESSEKKGEEDTEIIEIVDLLLDYAYSAKASDLHIEPHDFDTVFRFRVDGVLSDILVLNKKVHDRVVTRIKILSNLRTDEHYAAQDGHMTFVFSGEKVDIRVSIIPTTFGEKAVLRLLSEKTRQYSLEELGLGEKDYHIIKNQNRKPWGMILSTGPTGCGKTTTLYALLKLLNHREVNISTIEDPVEYSITGVNQIQVNPRTNLTFASGLRSIVRQDPNIIMVGEIRDVETADIAINAALTGHLVLSTLHTNDAATALPRLLDMNIEPFLVASTVNAVLAQRLIRKICVGCIGSFTQTPEDLEKDGYILPPDIKERIFPEGKPRRLYKGSGCAVCHHSGYFGRTGTFEILVVDAEIRKMILDRQSSDVIRNYAIQNGMTTMMDDAIQKVINGDTTVEEVLRVVRE